MFPSEFGSIRSGVKSVDKNLSPIDVGTQAEQLKASIPLEQIFAVVTAGCGVLPIIFATIRVHRIMA
jgi:hypothetical protein